MMAELDLMVIGQPVTLAESFGVNGAGCTFSATLDTDGPAGGEAEGTADNSEGTRLRRRRRHKDRGAVVRRRGRYGMYVSPYGKGPLRRRYRRISPLAAVRLLLPRRLQAQVGSSLDSLSLRDALAELKSYKSPPQNVHRVVVGVLCLLGHRLSALTAWANVQPHLKRELQRQMLDFDAAAQQSNQTAWADSTKATLGLTSEEVLKKGSLAVQTMLKWLEVNRLTRHEAIAAAVAKLAPAIGE